MAAAEADEREANVLLQLDDVTVSEVKGRDRIKLDKGDLTIFSIEATPEEHSHLRSLSLKGEENEDLSVVFAVCGEHKVPLLKRIPVLRQEPLQYTFVMPGLFLEMSMPDDIDAEEIEVLELLLQKHSSLRIKGQPVPGAAGAVVSRDAPGEQKVSQKVAGGITAAGDKVAGMITSVTPKVTDAVGAGAGKVTERITPCEQPTQLSQETLDHIRKTRLVTRNCVVISGHVAKSLVGLAQQVGKHVATTVGATGLGQRAGTSETAEATKEVGRAGVVAAVQVMDAGQQALKAVLTSSVDGIGAVVDHRYGEQAGGAVRDGLGCATDIVEAGMAVRSIGAKGLAKAAAKEAAKTAIEE